MSLPLNHPPFRFFFRLAELSDEQETECGRQRHDIVIVTVPQLVSVVHVPNR